MSKRRRILVDPKVQYSIAGRILTHWGLFVACLVVINVAVRVFANIANQPFWDALLSASTSQAPILFVMTIMLPMFLRDTMIMTNRFAGPMYRLRTALESVSRGDKVDAIRFRKGDFWQEVAGDFNTVVAQMETLKEQNKQLKAEIAQLQQEEIAV